MFVLLLASLISCVAAHGRMTFPPNRQGGSLEVAGIDCGDKDGGTQIEQGCSWLADAVEIPGGEGSTYTLTDPDLLTTASSIANPTARVKPVNRPWRAPGASPVAWPCGCHSGHNAGGCRPGDTDYVNGMDLPPNPTRTVWRPGSVVEVAQAIWANHGGGWSWRLCPKASSELVTEACFQKGALEYVGDDATVHWVNGSNITIPMRRTPDNIWSRNPIPDVRGEPEFAIPAGMEDVSHTHLTRKWEFSIIERVRLPSSLSPGEYLLSWRWDCEKTYQVWVNCADIYIEDSGALIVA